MTCCCLFWFIAAFIAIPAVLRPAMTWCNSRLVMEDLGCVGVPQEALAPACSGTLPAPRDISLALRAEAPRGMGPRRLAGE